MEDYAWSLPGVSVSTRLNGQISRKKTAALINKAENRGAEFGVDATVERYSHTNIH